MFKKGSPAPHIELGCDFAKQGRFDKAISEFNKAISIFEPKSIHYIQLSKALNHIVFDNHYINIRNTANEQQAKELVSIQNKLAFAVDMGYIRSFEELINEMRKMYHKRNPVHDGAKQLK